MTSNTTNLGASTPLPEGGKSLRIPLERTANGMAPCARGAVVHVAPRRHGATPPSAARLKRWAPQQFRSFTVTEPAEGDRLNTEAQEIVATIERVFATLGEDDQVQLKEFLCDDFHAFENGVRVTARELLDLMSRYHAEGRGYRWSVNSPQIEVEGNLAVVVYVNHGSITEAPGSDPIPMSWLETVVLRRQESRWRLAFLHSTRGLQSGA